MRLRIFMKAFLVAMIMLSMMAGAVSAATVEEKRQAIRNMTRETLDEIYRVQPKARDVVANAAGYAAFSITDVKLGFLGGGGGKGMAVNNSTGRETFMKTGAVQVGLGLGVKKYNVLFVFETEKALADFADSGWDLGGQATIAATDSVNGDSLEGAVSAGPDTWMYQLTDKGLEASLTVRGIRYFKDKDLN